MAQLRPLLLPLALVFAAIAVFEFGTRYGATNARALAIAEQTQASMDIFSQVHASMNQDDQAKCIQWIDRNIAMGVTHRNIWHLSRQAQETLDRTLAKALSLRGKDVVNRYAEMEKIEGLNSIEKQNLLKIQEALKIAKADLVVSKKPTALN